MLRVYCVYHELRRTGMRGVDGTRAPMSPDVVFSSTALRAASPDGGLKLFKQPGWTSGAQAFLRRRRGDGVFFCAPRGCFCDELRALKAKLLSSARPRGPER